jgi:hypothetical protein
MSTSVGGPIESVSIRGRRFPVAADAAGERKLGGFENAIESNGDGTIRIVKTRVPWMVSGVALEINEDRQDQEFLQNIADGKVTVPVAVTFASGVTYSGRGQIVEEIVFASDKSTAEVALSGPQKLTQQ